MAPEPFSRLGRMPRRRASLLALALVAAATVLGSCGEEDAELLPGGTAREITANLDAVEQLADEGDCPGAEGAALQVSEQIAALQGVDPRLKRALEQGAARLNEVVAGCVEESDATVPDVTELEPEPSVEEESEDQKELEKEREEAEKEREQEEKAAEKEEEAEAEEEPSLPPQAEGEGKGLDDEGDSGPSGEGGPSGGLGPGSPATGEGD